MPILVTCNQGHKLRVPDSKAGRRVQCPRCQAEVAVPAATSAGEPAPSVPANDYASQADEAPTASAGKIENATRNDHAAKPSFLHDAKARVTQELECWTSNEPGYVADPGRRRTAYWLASSMAAMALFTMLPAFGHLNLREAPAWSNIVLLLSLLQLAYALWFATAPDYSTAWVAMFAFAGIAVIYAAASAITLNARPGSELVFDLGELCRTTGRKPMMWSIAVVLIASTMAYFCGAFSHRWRKTYQLEAGHHVGTRYD